MGKVRTISVVLHIRLTSGWPSLCRNMDLFMFSMLNSQDRSAEEWSKIIVAADPRLRVASIEKPTGTHDAIIEVVLGQSN